jgi:hypothetical protein
MARPKLLEASKRSIKFAFRLTEQEKQKLFLQAEISGCAPGVVARDKIFKGKFPAPKLPMIDLKTFLELKKIGVNVNQLAKQANSGKFPFEIRKILSLLREQQQLIIKLLLSDRDTENR